MKAHFFNVSQEDWIPTRRRLSQFHTHRPQFHSSYGVVYPIEQLLKGDDQAVWLSSSLLGLTQLELRTFVRPASVLNTKVKFNVFHAVEFEYIYNA